MPFPQQCEKSHLVWEIMFDSSHIQGSCSVSRPHLWIPRLHSFVYLFALGHAPPLGAWGTRQCCGPQHTQHISEAFELSCFELSSLSYSRSQWDKTSTLEVRVNKRVEVWTPNLLIFQNSFQKYTAIDKKVVDIVQICVNTLARPWANSFYNFLFQIMYHWTN